MSEFGSGRVSFEDEVDLEQVVEYLGELLEGLRERRIEIERPGGHVTIHPAGRITMKVKVRQKRDREAVSVELRWRTAAPAENKKRFRVSTTDPEPEPAP